MCARPSNFGRSFMSVRLLLAFCSQRMNCCRWSVFLSTKAGTLRFGCNHLSVNWNLNMGWHVCAFVSFLWLLQLCGGLPSFADRRLIVGGDLRVRIVSHPLQCTLVHTGYGSLGICLSKLILPTTAASIEQGVVYSLSCATDYTVLHCYHDNQHQQQIGHANTPKQKGMLCACFQK